MAEADTGSDANSNDRCKAITSAGERCSRPAQEDGFCYQHDESDKTVSETETEQTSEDEEESGQQEQSESAEQQAESGVDPSGADTTDPEDVDVSKADVDVDDERIEGIVAVRQTVQSTAGQLIGREFDGVSEISPTQDGWRAVVEVIERSSIPDTQDVLGRYEVEVDEDGVVGGYRRIDRYRRGDTVAYEPD